MTTTTTTDHPAPCGACDECHAGIRCRELPARLDTTTDHPSPTAVTR